MTYTAPFILISISHQHSISASLVPRLFSAGDKKANHCI